MGFRQFLQRATGKDFAVYWPSTGVDDYGRYTSATPVEITCHWQDTKEDFVDREGKVRTSSAFVYTIYPVAFGGILWHGRLAACPYPNAPQSNTNALEIQKITDEGSVDNRNRLKTLVV